MAAGTGEETLNTAIVTDEEKVEKKDTGEISGSAGIILAILMLSGGIVSICIRKSKMNGGNIALLVLFGLAALVGISMHGSFSDLEIWGYWCLINAILAVVSIVQNSRKKKTKQQESSETEKGERAADPGTSRSTLSG